MDIKSLKSLTECAERAEDLVAQIQRLDVPSDVLLPNVPLPLSLQALEEWLASARESIRKPKLARSRALLEARGIDTAAIPASVLNDPDALQHLAERIDALPEGLRAKASEALGRALTKDLTDAESILARYDFAATAIQAVYQEAAGHDAICDLIVAPIAELPEQAPQITASARTALGLCVAFGKMGIPVPVFHHLDEACKTLAGLSRDIGAYDQLLALEGLLAERIEFQGLEASTATQHIANETLRISQEKLSLLAQLESLSHQHAAIGGQFDHQASSVADLRVHVRDAQENLNQRRAQLEAELGQDAFRIVLSLLKGDCPSREEAGDAELGDALRRALDCGYQFQLEVPHEGE